MELHDVNANKLFSVRPTSLALDHCRLRVCFATTAAASLLLEPVRLLPPPVIPFPAPGAYNYGFIGGRVPAGCQRSCSDSSVTVSVTWISVNTAAPLIGCWLNTFFPSQLAAPAFNPKQGSELRVGRMLHCTCASSFSSFRSESQQTLMQHVSRGSTSQKVVRGTADSGGGGGSPRGRLQFHGVFTLWTI